MPEVPVEVDVHPSPIQGMTHPSPLQVVDCVLVELDDVATDELPESPENPELVNDVLPSPLLPEFDVHAGPTQRLTQATPWQVVVVVADEPDDAKADELLETPELEDTVLVMLKLVPELDAQPGPRQMVMQFSPLHDVVEEAGKLEDVDPEATLLLVVVVELPKAEVGEESVLDVTVMSVDEEEHPNPMHRLTHARPWQEYVVDADEIEDVEINEPDVDDVDVDVDGGDVDVDGVEINDTVDDVDIDDVNVDGVETDDIVIDDPVIDDVDIEDADVDVIDVDDVDVDGVGVDDIETEVIVDDVDIEDIGVDSVDIDDADVDGVDVDDVETDVIVDTEDADSVDVDDVDVDGIDVEDVNVEDVGVEVIDVDDAETDDTVDDVDIDEIDDSDVDGTEEESVERVELEGELPEIPEVEEVVLEVTVGLTDDDAHPGPTHKLTHARPWQEVVGVTVRPEVDELDGVFDWQIEPMQREIQSASVHDGVGVGDVVGRGEDEDVVDGTGEPELLVELPEDVLDPENEETVGEEDGEEDENVEVPEEEVVTKVELPVLDRMELEVMVT